MVRWSGECQMHVKSQSELDIGGRETCLSSQGKPLKKHLNLHCLSVSKLNFSYLTSYESL